MQRLIDAYDEYIALLAKSEASLMGLAVSHGFRFAPDLVKRGAELRAEIAELKAIHQQQGDEK